MTIMTTIDGFSYSDIYLHVTDELKEYTHHLYDELFGKGLIHGSPRMDTCQVTLSDGEVINASTYPTEDISDINFIIIRSDKLSSITRPPPKIYGLTADISTIIIGTGNINPHIDIVRKSSLNKMIWMDPNAELVIEDKVVEADLFNRSWFFDVERMHYIRNAQNGFALLTVSSIFSYDEMTTHLSAVLK